MRKFKIRGLAAVCPALLGAVLLGGCSRETIKYQIAESIGTVGMYENGEPVETPRYFREYLCTMFAKS